MNEQDVVVVGYARTAMAEYEGTPGHGAFGRTSAVELAAIASKAALARAKVPVEAIEHVIFGNALQTGSDGPYGARHVALHAGLPVTTPALTVNRLCGSGMQSIADGARLLRLGEARYVLAGGMENMSQAPHVIPGARRGLRLGEGTLVDSLTMALRDSYCGMMMAETAERLAREYAIGRAEQDAYALRSHQLGAAAVAAGRFADEITAVDVRWAGNAVAWTADDHIKPDTSLEKLARLRPAFGEHGTVTAGNASGIVDGAAALVLTTAREARSAALEILGYLRGYEVVGVPPEVMGIGPAPAIRRLLARADIELEAIDLFEINEAFAAQYLAVERELELDRQRVNVNGGAIALGHPLGATGTRLAITLLRELRARGLRWGVTSACIGGGQGIALLWENA
jgi:acetyl-CoA acetyltransferase family protein